MNMSLICSFKLDAQKEPLHSLIAATNQPLEFAIANSRYAYDDSGFSGSGESLTRPCLFNRRKDGY